MARTITASKDSWIDWKTFGADLYKARIAAFHRMSWVSKYAHGDAGFENSLAQSIKLTGRNWRRAEAGKELSALEFVRLCWWAGFYPYQYFRPHFRKPEPIEAPRRRRKKARKRVRKVKLKGKRRGANNHRV